MGNRWKSKGLREIDRILRKNGWRKDRCKGDHVIYTKGSWHMSIPKSCNKMVIQREFKEKGIVV